MRALIHNYNLNIHIYQWFHSYYVVTLSFSRVKYFSCMLCMHVRRRWLLFINTCIFLHLFWILLDLVCGGTNRIIQIMFTYIEVCYMNRYMKESCQNFNIFLVWWMGIDSYSEIGIFLLCSFISMRDKRYHLF